MDEASAGAVEAAEAVVAAEAAGAVATSPPAAREAVAAAVARVFLSMVMTCFFLWWRAARLGRAGWALAWARRSGVEIRGGAAGG